VSGNALGSVPNNIRTTLEPSTRATESILLANTWIQECVMSHPGCREFKQHVRLPTRLVRVQRDVIGASLVANICRGDMLPTDTLYLTLSHCWGTTKFLVTTSKNICQFEASLPVEKLTRTFQDALFATNELGFEYIWIDSLCILQDNIDDWRREAPLMGEVYKNASCNISASAFSNGEEGFILPQRRLDPTPIFTVLNWKDCNHNLYCFVRTEPWGEVRTGPLFSRAWTLQEQLVVCWITLPACSKLNKNLQASRALHFGEDQIFWECKHTVANEVWPQGWRDTLFEKDLNSRRSTYPTWQFKVCDGLTSGVSICAPETDYMPKGKLNDIRYRLTECGTELLTIFRAVISLSLQTDYLQ
jgi:hypothetical protein